MVIFKTSPLTGELNSMVLNITKRQIKAWEDGAFLEDVMPHLNLEQREFLISGIPPHEWDTLLEDE